MNHHRIDTNKRLPTKATEQPKSLIFPVFVICVLLIPNNFIVFIGVFPIKIANTQAPHAIN